MAAVLDDLKAQAEEMRDKALAPINLAQELGGGSLPSLKDKPHRPGTKALSADRPPFKPRWLAQREEATKKSSWEERLAKSKKETSPSLKSVGKMALLLGSPAKSRAQPSQQQAAAAAGPLRPPPPAVSLPSDAEDSEQPATHIQFDHQYTYGLSNFDDEFSYTLMHVDQEARLKPALLVQHGIHNLSVRDVKRADLLASIEPPAPEELLAKEMELRAFNERKQKQQEQDGASASRYYVAPPSRETLILIEELEKAHVLEQLGNRTQRMVSNPELYRERSSILGAPSPSPAAASAGGRRKSPQKILQDAVRQRRMTAVQLAGLQELLKLSPAAAKEALGGVGRGGKYMSETTASDTRRRSTASPERGGAVLSPGSRARSNTIGGGTHAAASLAMAASKLRKGAERGRSTSLLPPAAAPPASAVNE